VKCKSDLDKSAKITKLRLQFECELSSFCQHDQKDLVRYLQRQLLVRDQRLAEQAYDLEQLRNVGMTESIKKKTEPVQILRRNDPDLVTSTVSRLASFFCAFCESPSVLAVAVARPPSRRSILFVRVRALSHLAAIFVNCLRTSISFVPIASYVCFSLYQSVLLVHSRIDYSSA
jgi:hypothetical protein